MSVAQMEAEKLRPRLEKSLSESASARKRRRKPAAGAQDDCFSCQERQDQCDRRRPYCTPCLNLGKDCSGYKTTLTWGVGVASRGKLRGLSLPVVSNKRAADSTESVDLKSPQEPPRKAQKLGESRHSSVSSDSGSGKPSSATTNSDVPHQTVSTAFDFVNINPAKPSPSTAELSQTPPAFDWHASFPARPVRASRPGGRKAKRHNLQPLQMPHTHPSRDYGVVPMTASIIGGYGHTEHGLSSQISPMVSDFASYGLVSPTFPDYSAMPLSAGVNIENSFYPNLPSPESTGLGQDEGHETLLASDHTSSFANAHALMNGMDLFTSQTCSSEMFPTISETQGGSVIMGQSSVQFCADGQSEQTPSLVPRSFGDLSIGKTHQQQFLIDYYIQVISPVIVAFDGPNNPYRAHILSLAVDSEPLQNAIAALAAGNIRIRKLHNPTSTNRSLLGSSSSSHDHSVRQSSYAHNLMDAAMDRLPQSSTNEASPDELHFKTSSITGLNEQLADPSRRQDDSILATLLILCLYHICDTGIGKFKTQFAGVKKLLALRGGSKGRNSKTSNWLTIMFTWFDAMTATVNDRESQLSGDDVDISTLTADEWALENLAGCDGRLFKIVAKLGRLNMLSQNRPVSECTPSSPTKALTPPPSARKHDYYSMSQPAHVIDHFSSSPDPDADVYEADGRRQFWKEWTDMRRRLHEWELDDSIRSTPVGSTSPENDRMDVYHISESFRYSALLYTERLAFPQLSSSHPKFQNLVTHAMYHITNVKSDVFLLWPLFITGTECVSEQSRHLIRERCLDMQKDSGFFNNISGLELLERIWRDDYQESGPSQDTATDSFYPSPPQQQQQQQQQVVTGLGLVDHAGSATNCGFRWRKAMQPVDGEYIVV